MRVRKRHVLGLLLLMAVFCMGCQKQEEIKGLAPGQYYTYYVNSSGTALVSRIYEAQAKDTEGIVAELFAQCQIAPEGGEGRRAIPSNVVVADKPQLEERIVNLYFDNTYTTMDQVTELLCKAAMAKTITQLDDVDYIRIHINGEVYRGFSSYTPPEEEAHLPGLSPETDTEEPASGNVAGENSILAVIRPAEKTLWSGTDFLDNTGDDTNKYVQAQLVLYFGNEEGKALETEVREVVYASTLSLERVVLNQLLEGPRAEGMTATLPKGLKIQGVSVRDGVCYVDFDTQFLEEPVNVTDQVELYSIVNSLTELSNVLQVQITVNGSPDVMLRNNISLAARFEKDQSLIASFQESEEETTEEYLPQETQSETTAQESEPEEITSSEIDPENGTEGENTAEDIPAEAAEEPVQETTVEEVTGI